MPNQALDINYSGPGGTARVNYSGGIAYDSITVNGSDWYWTVCACMTVATLTFAGLAQTKRREHRVFHYITAAITMVASIAYFSMASGIGFTPITVEFLRNNSQVHGTTREIFYVRYIDWFITTPLLLMDLLLTAGLPWPTLLYTILIDEVMVVTGLVGALVYSSYKWGYYTFGCVALFYIGYVLMFEARTHANHLGSDIGKTFLLCGTWTFGLWLLYPIAWGLCEGGNVIHPDGEAIFYGILDLMAKPVFGGLLLWGHKNIDPARLGLHIRDYGDDPAVHGSTKGRTEGSTGLATNGTSSTTTPAVGATNGTTATTATTDNTTNV